MPFLNPQFFIKKKSENPKKEQKRKQLFKVNYTNFEKKKKIY